MTTTLPRPPYDPAVAAALAPLGDTTPSLTAETIELFRSARSDTFETLSALIDVTHEEFTIPGHASGAAGGDDIVVSVFRAPGHDTGTPAPGFLYIHGGGMAMGTRFYTAELLLPDVFRLGGIMVSVEYRLAPEHPDPTPVEDCYAALVWMAAHADELGIDPERLVLWGVSAGGGLAAGTALLARDRQGPALLGQVLICPMLDDRNETLSSQQFVGIGVWDRTSNSTGWTALLGDRRGTDDVSIYAAPGRATDLSNLPAAFIEVASAEVFRDEDVAYAARIWADGGIAELHVWPGGTHGFSILAPESRIAIGAGATRSAWIAGLLAAASD
jgi:acetyl esterase/lipase